MQTRRLNIYPIESIYTNCDLKPSLTHLVWKYYPLFLLNVLQFRGTFAFLFGVEMNIAVLLGIILSKTLSERLILKTWAEGFCFDLQRPCRVEMTLCLKRLAHLFGLYHITTGRCLSAGRVNVNTTTAYLGYAESGVGLCRGQRDDTKRRPPQFSN